LIFTLARFCVRSDSILGHAGSPLERPIHGDSAQSPTASDFGAEFLTQPADSIKRSATIPECAWPLSHSSFQQALNLLARPRTQNNPNSPFTPHFSPNTAAN